MAVWGTAGGHAQQRAPSDATEIPKEPDRSASPLVALPTSTADEQHRPVPALRPIPVLLYHRIDPAGTSGATAISTPADVFRAHLAWLRTNGYAALSLDELDARIDGAEPEHEREVVITFDDGFACLADRAAPILRETGLRAAAFLITERLGLDGRLTWDQVHALDDEGIVDFHSHSHTHRQWDTADSVSEVALDLRRSIDTLDAHLGPPTGTQRFLAWPFGRATPGWERAADELGLTTRFIVQRGAVTRPGVHDRLPRLMVDGMPVQRLARWLSLFRRQTGATATNRFFGNVRQWRGHVGYR